MARTKPSSTSRALIRNECGYEPATSMTCQVRPSASLNMLSGQRHVKRQTFFLQQSKLHLLCRQCHTTILGGSERREGGSERREGGRKGSRISLIQIPIQIPATFPPCSQLCHHTLTHTPTHFCINDIIELQIKPVHVLS